MEVKFIEAGQGKQGPNHGKFGIFRFTDEWSTPSAVPLPEGMIKPLSLLRMCGWTNQHLWVCDLQTGEGAFFLASGRGHAAADLAKRQIWVCPMFEPFLTWLYTQDLTDLQALPSYVELPEAPFAFRGHRRRGQGR
jgi:hypothetical protein